MNKLLHNREHFVIKFFFIIICYLTITSRPLYSQDTLVVFQYPSAADVDVTVNCTVNAVNDTLRYSYILNSNVTSQQRVWGFFIDVDSPNLVIFSPAQWRGSKSGTRQAIMWSSRDSTYDIYPGDSLSGFELINLGLPKIFTFYAEGFVPIPEFPFGETPDSVIGNDVFENVFKGTTIAPALPPSPFDSVAFVDTLLSYTTQSRMLEWIASQTTADKYVAYFDSVKYYLQEDEIASAVTVLEQVLTDAETDNGSTLTSEAYALIRFNTEYLVERLPEE